MKDNSANVVKYIPGGGDRGKQYNVIWTATTP